MHTAEAYSDPVKHLRWSVYASEMFGRALNAPLHGLFANFYVFPQNTALTQSFFNIIVLDNVAEFPGKYLSGSTFL